MGLKLGAGGVLSDAGVDEEEVALTEKMGLKPEASRGLALLTVVVLAAVVTGFEAEEAAGVFIWVVSPNGLPAAAAGPPPAPGA